MKVLEVLDAFYPSIDGPINCLINVAKCLNENSLAEVELLVPSYPQKMEIEGLKIHRCKSVKGPEGYYVGLPQIDGKIKKLIKNGGYDIIHVHSPFTIGKYVINKAKKYKIPTILTLHTRYKHDFERTLKLKSMQKFMMKYIFRTINNADYVTSVSDGSCKDVITDGYKGKNICTIRNGTDLKKVDINPNEVENLKTQHNLQGKFVFLFVGRIVENKNVQFSLKVLKKIKDMGEDNFKFLIVGDGNYLSRLKEFTKTYNLEDNVEFLGRIKDREELAQIYKCSDLFLFPSLIDTCGIVVIEASANGIASAVIENTCASEVIKNRENGLSLPNDEDVWAKELFSYIKDKPLQKEVNENARNTVYKSWNDISLEYFELYKSILNKKPR